MRSSDMVDAYRQSLALAASLVPLSCFYGLVEHGGDDGERRLPRLDLDGEPLMSHIRCPATSTTSDRDSLAAKALGQLEFERLPAATQNGCGGHLVDGVLAELPACPVCIRGRFPRTPSWLADISLHLHRVERRSTQ